MSEFKSFRRQIKYIKWKIRNGIKLRKEEIELMGVGRYG